MTQQEYIKALQALYLTANASDTEDAQDWQDVDDCSKHCRPLDQIVRDLQERDILSENWLED